MKDEILLEMMASIMQEMYDEGHGSEFRPAMQNVLVAFNNRGLTPRAADALRCEEEGCNEPAVMFYCEGHAP
jgi:hypothetical protein